MENRKIVTIHQPESFPWMGFFNKMMMADQYVILDTVAFRKNYFQNRNQILTKNGPVYLTIPVDHKSHKNINEIRIVNNQNWRKKQLATIMQTYSKSPFFAVHRTFFEELYAQDHELIAGFNLKVIEYLRHALKIETPLILASEMGVEGASTELLLDICKKLEATHYLAGKDGVNYLETELFDIVHIEIVYQNYLIPEYLDFIQDGFHPYMSVLDLIFNYETEQARALIASGDLLNERI